MSKDIENIIAHLTSQHASFMIHHIHVSHPGDDDGVWYITDPDIPGEVQIESSTWNCPFLVESDFHPERYHCQSIEDVVSTVLALFQLGKTTSTEVLGGLLQEDVTKT